MLILFAFCGQRVPKGSQTAQMGPQLPKLTPKGIQKEPNVDHGEPRSPKIRVQGGVREKVKKKNGLGRETLKQIIPKLHNFGSHVAYSGVIFSMFFQGRFLIDLLMVLGLIFDGFWDVFLIIFGSFSRTPEPLIFDNGPMR